MKSNNYSIVLLFFVLFQLNSYSQVGIGTTDPHVSSILEIESTTQGILTPRMTTLQRIAIATPAEGLLVFDTDEGSFFYYSSASWVKQGGAVSRDNYRLIKSAADLEEELTAGGNTEYLLTTDFLYEINGVVNLSFPINLNGAYIFGADTNEDILAKATGDMFAGALGGSVKGLTLTTPGGTIFNLTGSVAKTERLVFRDCVVANSNSVGSISSFGFLFISTVQYVNNAAGIVYENVNQVLLNSQGWGSDNGGVYETFIGDFDVITKQGGFSKVIGATAAMDISGITSLSIGGIRIVDFFGGGNYIIGISPATYIGYDFSNKWDVNSPGIPVETDGTATGNFYYDGALTTGFSQNISNGTAVEVQGDGTFEATTLFRFTASGGNNRLTYDGLKPREFQVNASMSVRVSDAASNFYAFVLAKNGVMVTESNAIVYIDSNSQIQNVSINAAIGLVNGDYIEVYVQRLTGSGTDNLVVFSENLSIK